MNSRARRRVTTLFLVLFIAASQIGAAQAPENTAPTSIASNASSYTPSSISGMVRYKDKAYILLEAIWKTSSVPVCWEHGVQTGVERTWVRDAIKKSWEHPNSGLTFIGWGECANAATGIRIVVLDDGSADAPHTVGLGTNISGKQNGMVLNFQFKTWNQGCAATEAQRQLCIRSIAVHEFGHAIGFAHEQNRADTPGECADQHLEQGPDGDSPLSLTPWDKKSVMNYCNPTYLNGGVLSAYDLSTLQHFYGT